MKHFWQLQAQNSTLEYIRIFTQGCVMCLNVMQ